MGRDANFGFLARQLLATELCGPAVEAPGGLYAALPDGTLGWGVWQPDAAGAEALVQGALEAAKSRGVTLSRVVLLAPSGPLDAAQSELADALYVYGLPAADGPDSIQTLQKPPHVLQRLKLDIADAAAQAWPDPGTDGLTAAGWTVAPDTDISWREARSGGSAAGRMALLSRGLVGRICALEPSGINGAEKDTALALIETAAQLSAAAGHVALTAWVSRSGMRRFLMAEAGFGEQATAAYHQAES